MTDKDYDARYAMIAAFFDKGWTTELPTVEGWYWVCSPEDDVLYEPQCAVVGFVDGRLVCDVMGSTHQWELTVFSHWLGPLPVPEPPE